jgi:high affinity Mn2+ porin
MTRFRTLSGRWLVMKKPSSQTKGLRWTDLLSAALGCIALATVLACSALTAHAQQPDQETKPQPDQGAKSQKPDQEAPADPDPSIAAQDADPNPETLTTMFPHSDSTRYWISAQWNVILQWHPAFPAKYSGPNSMNPHGENATSHLETVYAGYELSKRTEVLFDLESAGGKGLSNALGLAGFTNLDVVRNPQLSQDPYVARWMIHQIIPLSNDTVEAERTWSSLFTELPARRLEIRFGKFSLADFFDLNNPGSDSHLQFMNWTVDNNGAYDYAANTRGYTDGVIIEYEDRTWGVRFAETLMPKIANGINLDADLARSRSENLELEIRQSLVPHRKGVLRLLTYLNQANMGSYRTAIDNFLLGLTPVPEVTDHLPQTRAKLGFGVNFEQQLSSLVRVFGRGGWNDGRNESFAYTEVDNTVQAGMDLKGDRWKRKLDKVGAVFVSNGISAVHAQYLALGGIGFLLGDGALNYGRETIFEGYYTAHMWRGIFTSFDLQHVNNPGYNRDRGPVLVPGLRLHIDF